MDDVGQLEDRSSPVDGARIPEPTTWRGYGAVREPTEREPEGHVHAGVDVGGVPGTPVLAPEAGEVVQVGTLPMRPPWTGYAPAVLIRGASSGRWHLLAHLSGAADGSAATAPLVHVGDRVELRQPVGYIGHERHVHWEVRTRPHARRAAGETTATITVDPRAWLEGTEVPAPSGPSSPPLDPRRGRARRRRARPLVLDTATLDRFWSWAPLSSSTALGVGDFADE
jgi:murein DD-endopeptidase MepM/ murein hydrolase activator NlpD